MVLVLRFPRPAVSLALAGLLLVLGSVLGVSARAQTGEPILRIETGTHTARLGDAATDAAGRVLVTASEDKTARIWSLPDLRPLGVLRPPIGPEQDGLLFAVAVSPDGRLAAVAGALGPRGGEKSVLLFDLRSREVVRRWAGPPNGTYSLAFSVDGTQLVAGFGGAYGIRVWSVADGRQIFKDGNYADRVYGVSFARDGRLATTSFDGFLRLYDTTGGLLRKVTVGPGRPLRCAFSPDGGELAVGFSDPAAVVVMDGHTLALIAKRMALEVPDANTLALLLNPGNTVPGSRTTLLRNVAWSRDGTRLFAAGDFWTETGTAVLVWSAAGRGPRQMIDAGFAEDATGIVPLADGAIVTISQSGDIVLTGPEGTRRSPVSTMRADLPKRGTLQVSGDGKRVAWMQQLANGRWDIADAGGFNFATAAQPPKGLLMRGAYGGRRLSVLDWEDRPDPKLTDSAHSGSSRALALEPHEVSHSVAVWDWGGWNTVLEGRVLLGTDWNLRLFDGTGQPVWVHPLPAVAWDVDESSDGRLAVAALGDGTVRWYRLRDGQELLALFLTRDAKRWVAFTPSGYYDASPGGEDLIGWHVNRGPDQAAHFFPASRFADTMHRPDVINQVLATLDEGEAVKLANAAAGRNDARITPEQIVTLAPPVLESVSVPERFASDSITIQYRVRTPSDAPMIGEPRVKVNGEWQPRSRSVGQVAQDGTQNLVVSHLPPRDSVVEIYVDSRHGPSVPLAFSLKWDGRAALSPGQQGVGAQRKPRLFLLAVGISQYQLPDLRLNFADHDAERFVGAMKAQQVKRYSEVNSKLLVNGDATLKNVKDGLAWLQSQAAEDDVGILFLAGHGFQLPDKDYFYAPADFDPNRPRDTGIDYKTIRQTLVKFSGAGNKAIFLIDTCYAGGALGPNLGASSADSFAAQLSRPEYNVVVLTASSGDQLSYEDATWGDGAFTKALLEGVAEGKADPAQTGEITVFDLSSYVTKRVKVLTEQRQIPRLLMPSGGVEDFAIATH
jgi:WD40 repeat protein